MTHPSLMFLLLSVFHPQLLFLTLRFSFLFMTCFVLGWQVLEFTAGAPWDVDFIDVAKRDSLF